MYKDYPAAYQVSKGSALQVDKAFYERVRDAKDGRTLIESFEVPIRTGRAWKVPAGHVFRVTTPVGPQVGDFNVWNANDPRERLWAARTRQLQGAHVSTHDRLWSNLPFLRPLVTITDDSLAALRYRRTRRAPARFAGYPLRSVREQNAHRRRLLTITVTPT